MAERSDKKVTREPSQSIDSDPVYCARCLVELRPGSGDFYRVFIEAVADPTPPDITGEELASDIRQRIQHLIAQMAELS